MLRAHGAAGLKISDISADIRLRPGNEGVSARGPFGTGHDYPVGSGCGRLDRPPWTGSRAAANPDGCGTFLSRPACRGRPQNFLSCDRDQPMLLPPDLRDWLSDDHLA